MSVETDADADTSEDDVQKLGRQLGEAIRELPEYQTFEEKSQAVEESDEAQEKIQQFEQQRHEFMLARQTGEADQQDMVELQQIQNELHSMPVMSEFLQAREQLVDRLEAVNETISEPLEIDFGKEAGGCCNDE